MRFQTAENRLMAALFAYVVIPMGDKKKDRARRKLMSALALWGNHMGFGPEQRNALREFETLEGVGFMAKEPKP